MNKSILNEFVSNTEKYSSNLVTNSEEKLLLRPLIPSDVKLLTSFLEGLSVETRRLSTFDSYDSSMAKELCDAINKYDKLRFVLINSLGSILGLIEFTLDIPESDIERFLSYGINLDVSKTCRFGPTLTDSYQNQGVGKLLFPYIIQIVKLLNKNSVILYGGVLADNERAIRYYLKHGFVKVGSFINTNQLESLDMILYIEE